MIEQEIQIENDDDPVFENDSAISVKSNNLKDHTLVGSYVIIPKSEVSSPFELSQKEWLDTKELLDKVKEYIDKTYKPDGYNLGWNVGEAAGQSVKHAHLHILPRYSDEPFAGKGIRHWLKKSENIRKSIADKIEN